MILIVDNSERKYIGQTRNAILAKGIPCAASRIVDSLDLLFPARLCIVTERYLLEDVKLMASFHQKKTCIKLIEETKNFADLVLSEYEKFYREDMESALKARLTFHNRSLGYCGMYTSLTMSEMRIMNLLIASRDYCSWEMINGYCLKGKKNNQGSVAVHISNINAKIRKMFSEDIVECKRFQGYRLKRELK